MYIIGYLLMAIASVLDVVMNIFLFIVIARAVLSWVSPDPFNPIVRFINNVTEPVLYPIRSRLPVHFGGIEGGTRPEYHIRQCEAVRRAGGYHIYHHDMFQNQDPDRTPPEGIPDPDFRSFHREVFDYLREHTHW